MNSLPAGVVITDISGTTLDADDREVLLHPMTGGIILFARNFVDSQQLRELTSEIKRCRPSLLIAVDQEGGRIQRFQFGLSKIPAMHDIGQYYDVNADEGLRLAFNCGQLMAHELIELGVDISFAPVLDRYLCDSKIIADRAFHHDPQTIIQLAESFINGMNKAGMQATGKHFPGHGGIVDDSHLVTPVDNRMLEDIQRQDLVPFMRLASKLGAVMTAHILFPNIDAEIPTYSKFWLQTVLRRELKFKGLIFSDDLMMSGATTEADPLARAEVALAAGCDMILSCNDREATIRILDHAPVADLKPIQRLTSMYAKKSAALDEETLLVMKEFITGESWKTSFA